MAENYARENNKTNCRNCKNHKNSSMENSMNSAVNNRSPLSKQNAAQRKTQDCDR